MFENSVCGPATNANLKRSSIALGSASPPATPAARIAFASEANQTPSGRAA